MLSTTNAPIALFAYNRPRHLEETLNALRCCDGAAESALYIFCDGPIDNASESDRKNIETARSIAHRESWCGEVHVIESKSNKSLANSIIDGVSEILERHDRIIVLEDDLVVSRGFLKYMNEGLERYNKESRVGSVSGYNYPIETDNLPDSFFVRGADCWGWGTWAREWRTISFNPEVLLQKMKASALSNIFDFNGAYPYTSMLRNSARFKRKNSWAVCMYASEFLAGKLMLVPGRSLVRHTGYQCGTNAINRKSAKSIMLLNSAVLEQSIGSMPDEIIEHPLARQRIEEALRRCFPEHSRSFFRRVLFRVVNHIECLLRETP